MRSIEPILCCWPHIAAVLPRYDAREQARDITRFYFIDGRCQDLFLSVRPALAKMHRYFSVGQKDLLRRSAACLGGRTRKVPLCLHRDFCLVPVRSRTDCLTSKHSPTGYFVLQQLYTVAASGPRHTILVFRGGKLQITVPQSKRTVERQIELAESLSLHFHYNTPSC